MNRTAPLLAVSFAAASLLFGGCVDQKKYDSLADTAQTSGARVEGLSQDVRTLQESVVVKQRRIDELEGETRQLRSINDDLNGQISGIRGRQQALVDELGNIRLTMLDPETDRALQALAAQYPDLIKYDAERGMLQFMADLTFDSGSDQVKPKAREGLQRLAQILTASSASSYDVRLVGHTDSQPLGASRNKWKTNRHLSVARSIAVEEVMRGSGIPGGRLETSGWGEYRPMVNNTSSGNTPQNRRVEIYIVPGSGYAMGAPDPAFPVSAPASAPAPRQREEMPMK
jgi:chemotaxis protein MotB